MRHANISIFVPHEGCTHACSFCNQKTITGQKQLSCTSEMAVATIELALSHLQEKAKEAEIAFFGGSFTAIERARMISLLKAAYPYVSDGRFKGIRISTRPDAIDGEILDTLEEYGVTAIELGAQSMSDEVLRLNRRGHLSEDVRKASGLIKARGFELGLQMMTGLYGDSDDGAVYTASEIIKISPSTVRIYPTVVLENTYLAELMRNGEYRPQTLEEATKLCSLLIRMFYDNGINVIRVGLHSGGGVEEGYLAGAYHPAFRELCEGEIYYEAAKACLEKSGAGKKIIYVPTGETSKMVGQSRINLARLENLGYTCKVKESTEIEKYKVLVCE